MEFEIKKESVEEYEKITIKEEPFLTDINNSTVVANLKIKSEPIDRVEQDLPINRGENVIIKEEFSETFVKSETLVDTSELYNDQIKNDDPLEVHDRKNKDKDLSSNTIWANPSERVKLENQEYELSLNTTMKKEFLCTICLKKFSTRGIVLQHISRAHPLHFKNFDAKAAVKEDISNDHEGEKLENQDQDLSPNTTEDNRFQCSICSKLFGTKATLKRHISQVHEKKQPVQCPFCPTVLNFKHNLKRHIALVHERSKPFQCLACPKKFGTKMELKRHISAVHEKKKLFKCDLCESRFSQRGSLKYHISAVHEKKKPFQCGNCPSRFVTENECIKHVAKIHEKNKPNKCPNCPARFEYGGELKNHLTLVHGGRVFNA